MNISRVLVTVVTSFLTRIQTPKPSVFHLKTAWTHLSWFLDRRFFHKCKIWEPSFSSCIAPSKREEWEAAGSILICWVVKISKVVIQNFWDLLDRDGFSIAMRSSKLHVEITERLYFTQRFGLRYVWRFCRQIVLNYQKESWWRSHVVKVQPSYQKEWPGEQEAIWNQKKGLIHNTCPSTLASDFLIHDRDVIRKNGMGIG